MDFDVDGLSDGELAKLSKAVAERLQRRKVLAAGAGAAVGGSFLAGQETARADPQNTESGTYGDGDEDWNVQDIDANHVASNSVTTDETSPNVAENGPDLIAYDDGGTAKVVSAGDRSVVYSGSDIGALINTINADFPGGIHLHLADLFNYSTDIELDKPIRITGRYNAQEGLPNALATNPTGLDYTGSGTPFHVHPTTDTVTGFHLENLYLNAGTGTTAGFKIDGQDQAMTEVRCRNIQVNGTGGPGFEVVGNIFASTFADIYSYESGGDGIKVHSGSASFQPNHNWFGRLHSRQASSAGVVVQGNASHYSNIYSVEAGANGIEITRGNPVSIGMLFSELAADNGVKISNDFGSTAIGAARVRQAGIHGMTVETNELYVGHIVELGSNFKAIQFGATTNATPTATILSGSLENGIDIPSQSDSKDSYFGIGDVDNFRSETDGDSNNRISLSFDQLYSGIPELDFFRRGGGITNIGVQTDGSGNVNGVNIDISNAGGTIDAFVTPAR
jgi:hypothetical protein